MVIGCPHACLNDVSTICRIRSVRKIWEYGLCTDCTGQGNDFELIPTVKMETRNPIEGYFGSEFLVIYNNYGVMAA